MNVLINRLTSDKIIRLGTLVAMGLLLFHLGFILLNLNRLPPVIPIYNQLPWGQARLGEKLQVFLPFLLVTGMVLLNTVIAAALYERMPLVSRILGITSLLLSLLSAVFIVRMMQLII